MASPGSRFSANFARLGFHHGFGLSVTLPALAGQQTALDLLLTGRRVPGEEAFVARALRSPRRRRRGPRAAHALASELARSAPLAVRSIRATLRVGLVERLEAALEREASEQDRLRETEDFREGIAASLQRREPRFEGQVTRSDRPFPDCVEAGPLSGSEKGRIRRAPDKGATRAAITDDTRSA